MKIRIHDEFGPEALAMLQALYSRSADSVDVHVEKVRQRGSATFMQSYYVGYGHASIGDCGVTTLFLEDVSTLASKAFQDNPLYAGQETSTRYIDFARQRLIDPAGAPAAAQIQKDWVEFYLELQPPMVDALRRRFPRGAADKETVWDKAIRARAFDVARGFLPAGVATQFSWTTSFRQAYDNLSLLIHHPLAEVRQLAASCLDALKQRYPSSFSHRHDEEREDFNRSVMQKLAYARPTHPEPATLEFQYRTDIDNAELERQALNIISTRPIKAHLPRILRSLGTYRCRFLLDFGSFRDLQRHRNGLCQMPMITLNHGFHPWYIQQLPNSLRQRATAFIAAQLHHAAKLQRELGLADHDTQYYLPLGMNVVCDLTYDLPQMVYVAELRSKKSVHPTLRWVAVQMGRALQKEHPALALHVEFDDGDFDVRRGTHDIVDLGQPRAGA